MEFYFCKIFEFFEKTVKFLGLPKVELNFEEKGFEKYLNVVRF